MLLSIFQKKQKKSLGRDKNSFEKNGKLLISAPANNFSNFFDPAWYFGHRHYSKKQMQEIFENSEFQIEKMKILGGFYELFSMILFYPFKWFFNMEIPFKEWFDKKRDEEYLKKENGFNTLFVFGRKN